ncbi:MAG: hypothetical protein KJ721_02905 [Nanoarchaeota archaeon]|nr:hypothetical protein [Nanoarchaeota archaeon]
MAPIYQFEISKEQAEGFRKLGYNPLELKSEQGQIADLGTKGWVAIPYESIPKGIQRKGNQRMLIDPARLSYNPTIEEVGQKLDLTLRNTAKDFLEREFIGDMNWFEMLRVNLALGNTTPGIREFTAYGHILGQASKGDVKIYDASGTPISSETCKNYREDIFGVASPWRAEWLDADFKVKNGKLYVNSNHIFEDGKLIPENSRVLAKNTLMEGKTPGISLEDWLENPTAQGFPRKNIKEGSLYYRAPISDNNSVARFDADSDGAYLYCYRYPSGRYSGLGVRAVRHE